MVVAGVVVVTSVLGVADVAGADSDVLVADAGASEGGGADEVDPSASMLVLDSSVLVADESSVLSPQAANSPAKENRPAHSVEMFVKRDGLERVIDVGLSGRRSVQCDDGCVVSSVRR